MVTMAKQGLEDKRRHDADAIQNNRLCQVLGPNGQINNAKWMDVRVGDVLCIRNNEETPADIVILATSEEEGRCFVETCNLDGETNLKRRMAVPGTAKRAGCRQLNDPPLNESKHQIDVVSMKGKLEYEQPNNRLYNFIGRLTIENETQPIGPTNIALRGCSIRSCAYAYGVVIFTGSETKVMQNARSTPSKQSNIYRTVNRCILLIFFTQFVLCLISTISNGLWSQIYTGKVWYLPYVSSQSTLDTLVSFFTFLILYNNLVPISLYVSLDMIKVIQAKMITNDDQMVYNGANAIARTSDLNEELGQIRYIFSDKTGTLTQNLMEFRKCSIGDRAYGYGTTEIGRAAAALTGQAKEDQSSDQGGDAEAAQVNYTPTINFDDPRLLQDMANGRENAGLIDDFLTVLSVCHTVVPETDPETGVVNYRASSPDEEALVKAARCLGYNFTDPAPNVSVEIRNKAGEVRHVGYEILNINEFNSSRKRMSVVARTKDGRYILYCKGADNVMLPRTKDDGHTNILKRHIDQFAREGLRTLVLSKKELTEEEYKAWDRVYDEASTALENRDAKLEAAAEMIEVNMQLIGATAIEDKLQEGVPDAIHSLAVAGINVWVLTGDKEETAINIGYACQLLEERMHLLIINMSAFEEISKHLDKILALSRIKHMVNTNSSSREFALVIDGRSLVHVFPHKESGMSDLQLKQADELATKLLIIASCCKAVIACRVSPAQKADIVRLVKTKSPGNPITLAIGDGANDVNMIQTAHVGVGICGQEGVQAVNASDYAISQFRFLKRLVLVHGRNNYKRISKVILYSFYKNISLVIMLFLFNFFNGQSGTTLFESFVMAGWNFFLALPIIAAGIFDEDVPGNVAMRFPQLYMTGPENADLNVHCFVLWIGNAVYHACISFILPIWFMRTFWDASGITDGLYLQGTIAYGGLLMTMNAKVVLITQTWTHWNFTLFGFSVFLFFFFLFTYPFMTFLSWDYFGVGFALLNRPLFWLTFLLVPVAATMLDVSIFYLTRNYRPSPSDILRERYLERLTVKAAPLRMVKRSSESFDSTLGIATSVFNHRSRDEDDPKERITESLSELMTAKVNANKKISSHL